MTPTSGLDLESSTEIDFSRPAPVDTDEKRAWRAAYPGQPDIPVEVVAGSHAGQPVWFEVIPPWRVVSEAAEQRLVLRNSSLGNSVVTVIVAVSLLLALWMARRNLRRGRGDKSGAIRVGLFIFLLMATALLVRADHLSHLPLEWDLLTQRIGMAMFRAAVIAILYLAIEPYVRRRWPTLLISWSRLLSKKWRDPLVARDVLMGSVAALFVAMLFHAASFMPGADTVAHAGTYQSVLSSFRQGVGALLVQVVSGLLPAFIITFVMVGFAIILRKKALGVTAVLLLFGVIALFDNTSDPVAVFLAVIVPVITMAVLVRLGVLALYVFFTVGNLMPLPITFNPSAIYFEVSLLFVLSILALIGYGFWFSMGERRLVNVEG